MDATTRPTAPPFPATETDPMSARYILDRPERVLGYWDDDHLRFVTGYDWSHWRKVFDATTGFETVFRSISTKTYLTGSGRMLAMEWRSNKAVPA